MKYTKESFLILLSLLLVFAFTACTDKESSTQPSFHSITISEELVYPELAFKEETPSKEYAYNEQDFLTAYDHAVSQIKKGETPKDSAPSSPLETGFAIIPLDKETYGTDNLAVLPIGDRALTEEEFLELAEVMQDIPGKDLLTRTYSYWYSDTRYRGNRDLFWEEEMRIKDLLPQFFYEGKAPKLTLTNLPEDKNPILVSIPSKTGKKFETFWIYPTQEMTDEQISLIIANQYSPDLQVYFKPLVDQVPYDSLPALVQQYISEYKLSDAPLEKMYSFYDSGRTPTDRIIPMYTPYWSVDLHFSEGNDYNLRINADNGSFMSWKKYPTGTCSEVMPNDYLSDTNNSAYTHTNTEIKTVIMEYMRDTFSLEIVEDNIYIDYSEGVDFYYGATKKVNVALSSEQIVDITVLISDLDILGYSCSD